MNRIWKIVRTAVRPPSSPIEWFALVVAVVAVAGLGVWGYILYFPNLPSSVKVYDVVKLNKNWTDEERQKYYHSSQGSQVMPYDWFIALEQPNNKQLFLSNEYLTKMRIIQIQIR